MVSGSSEELRPIVSCILEDYSDKMTASELRGLANGYWGLCFEERMAMDDHLGSMHIIMMSGLAKDCLTGVDRVCGRIPRANRSAYAAIRSSSCNSSIDCMTSS